MPLFLLCNDYPKWVPANHPAPVCFLASRQVEKALIFLEIQRIGILKFGSVAADYIKQELESERSRLAYSTREIYGVNIRRWILDRWKDELLDRIRRCRCGALVGFY